MENSNNNITSDISQNNTSGKPESPISLPIAIIVAGILIAGSVLYANRDNSDKQNPTVAVGPAYGTEKSNVDSLKPVSSADHILGNPDAPVKIVEFSDLECPYCKMFHDTMHQVMATYGKDGKVAWIYRNFPIDNLHPTASQEANASECVAELGGNQAYWKYIDALFATPSARTGKSTDTLATIAQNIGIDRTKFLECQNTSKHAELIKSHITDGINSGAEGTPYSIVIAPNGTKYPISGAMNLTGVQSLIETALKQTKQNWGK